MNKLSEQNCWNRVKRIGAVFYLIATLALVQALFAAFTFIMTINHNSNMVLLFRGISVLFFLWGILILASNAIDYNASFKKNIFASFFISVPTAFSIFATKGFFMFIITFSFNPDVLIAINFFNYWDIITYFLFSFIVLLVVVAINNLRTKYNNQ